MKRIPVLLGILLLAGLLSGCSLGGDPLIGIWKIDPPTLAGGSMAYPEYLYALNFKPNHVLVLQYTQGFPGTRGDAREDMLEWERIDSETIKIKAHVGGSVIGATVDGSNLQIKDDSGRVGNVSGVRVDSTPPMPMIPK